MKETNELQHKASLAYLVHQLASFNQKYKWFALGQFHEEPKPPSLLSYKLSNPSPLGNTTQCAVKDQSKQANQRTNKQR